MSLRGTRPQFSSHSCQRYLAIIEQRTNELLKMYDSLKQDPLSVLRPLQDWWWQLFAKGSWFVLAPMARSIPYPSLFEYGVLFPASHQELSKFMTSHSFAFYSVSLCPLEVMPPSLLHNLVAVVAAHKLRIKEESKSEFWNTAKPSQRKQRCV